MSFNVQSVDTVQFVVAANTVLSQRHVERRLRLKFSRITALKYHTVTTGMHRRPQQQNYKKISSQHHHHHTITVLRPFFRDHPGEPVPEENFWTLCCKGRLTEADTPTIRLGATPSGLTSAHLHHLPTHPNIFYLDVTVSARDLRQKKLVQFLFRFLPR